MTEALAPGAELRGYHDGGHERWHRKALGRWWGAVPGQWSLFTASFFVAACATGGGATGAGPAGTSWRSAHTSSVPVVAFRSVDARAVRLRLQLGRRCRAQLADALADGVFETHEAQRAGCRLRPFRGPLTIRASGPGGSVTRAVEVPRDGRVVVSFSALGEMFASPGLTAFERLDFGVAQGISGWAGRIDVVKLRAAWADRHARAIAAGRGAPGFFVQLYPNHPALAQTRAMALQERMRRQLDDYAAVAEGQRSAFDFLLRHVWSPFRRTVEGVVAGGTLPPVMLEGAEAAPPQ